MQDLKRCIGIFIAGLDDAYQFAIWQLGNPRILAVSLQRKKSFIFKKGRNKIMKMTQVLQDIYGTLLMLSMVLVFWMIINEFTQYDALGFTGLWYELDLRVEGSFATWLESIGIFLCFLPAYAIVRSDKNKVISPISRLFFLALTAAAVFLAADEMLGIHERVGEKMGNATNLGAGTFLEGFAWVFIYGPIILGGFVLFAYTVRDVMKYLTSET